MRRAGNSAGNLCDTCQFVRSMRGSVAGNKGFCVRVSTLTQWKSLVRIQCRPFAFIENALQRLRPAISTERQSGYSSALTVGWLVWVLAGPAFILHALR
jgi:hypothetical protein